MRVSRRNAALACGIAFCAAACSHNPAPTGWLPEPEEAPSDAYGAWIEVRLRSDEERVRGEFLAAQNDSMYVLESSGAVRAVAVKHVERAQIAYYDADLHELGLWTFLGTVSTLSHGVYLVFTAPMWILTGILTASQESKQPLVGTETIAVSELARTYARFPNGLPANLPRQLPTKEWNEGAAQSATPD